jgi:hypothetical protein
VSAGVPCGWLALPAMLVAVVACHPHASGGTVVDGAVDARPNRGDVAATPRVVEAAAPIADDALPSFSSDDLTARGRHLLEAIQKDEPDLANDIVFPRDAYIAVKDVPDPGRHWDQKVLAAFKSQVHVLHRRTKGVERAVFTSIELGQPASEALPKKKDLKRMLWRARRSRLGFTIDGRPSHFDIIEMTGWRGAWYVTRLR